MAVNKVTAKKIVYSLNVCTLNVLTIIYTLSLNRLQIDWNLNNADGCDNKQTITLTRFRGNVL